MKKLCQFIDLNYPKTSKFVVLSQKIKQHFILSISLHQNRFFFQTLKAKLSYRSLRNNFRPSIASVESTTEQNEIEKCEKALQKKLLENIKSNYFYASFDSLLMKWSVWNCSNERQRNILIELSCQAFYLFEGCFRAHEFEFCYEAINRQILRTWWEKSNEKFASA